MIGSLTVEEMLMYTAELKLPSSVSKESKRARVEQLIDALGLEVCRQTRIGSALVRGISGGQAKRVNIGIALITDPRILFLVSTRCRHKQKQGGMYLLPHTLIHNYAFFSTKQPQ